jgi:hypothetical protein
MLQILVGLLDPGIAVAGRCDRSMTCTLSDLSVPEEMSHSEQQPKCQPDCYLKSSLSSGLSHDS